MVQLRAPSGSGRRERGKLEKRRRIQQAAHEIFREKGYAAATTREIAERADIANATLFAYIRDKRDLLMMIVNDELDAITASAPQRIVATHPLLEQLVEYFKPRYRFWAREPDLSRLAVQQTFASLTDVEEAGVETARFHARRTVIVAQLSDLIRAKQKAKEIRATHDAKTLAWLFHAIYQAEQRVWLMGRVPRAAAGVARLRELFAIVLSGVT